MAAQFDEAALGDLSALSRRFLEAAQSLHAPSGLPAAVWLRKGSWLYQTATPVVSVFMILDGSVVRRKASLGGESLAVDLVCRGGVLGFRSWLGYGSHRSCAQCASDSLVCRIPAADLDAVLTADRELEHLLLAAAAHDLGAAQQRMLHVATLSVRDRLLIVLAQLAHDFTTMNDEQTLVLAPPMSRTDMAALAGMTPESLSRCIRTLEAEGLAHFSRHHVVIPSQAAFRAALEDIGIAADGQADLALAG